MHTVRHQRHTTPDGVRKYADLEGQEKKVDDTLGNDTDVNNIVARFARTGIMPPSKEAQYADVTHLQGDLAEMITKGKEAEKELQALDKTAKEQKASQAKKDAQELKELREARKASLEQQPVDNPGNPG